MKERESAPMGRVIGASLCHVYDARRRDLMGHTSFADRKALTSQEDDLCHIS